MGVSFYKSGEPLKNGAGAIVRSYLPCSCEIDFGTDTTKMEVYCTKDLGSMEDLKYKLDNMGNFYQIEVNATAE